MYDFSALLLVYQIWNELNEENMAKKLISIEFLCLCCKVAFLCAPENAYLCSIIIATLEELWNTINWMVNYKWYEEQRSYVAQMTNHFRSGKI